MDPVDNKFVTDGAEVSLYGAAESAPTRRGPGTARRSFMELVNKAATLGMAVAVTASVMVPAARAEGRAAYETAAANNVVASHHFTDMAAANLEAQGKRPVYHVEAFQIDVQGPLKAASFEPVVSDAAVVARANHDNAVKGAAALQEMHREGKPITAETMITLGVQYPQISVLPKEAAFERAAELNAGVAHGM